MAALDLGLSLLAASSPASATGRYRSWAPWKASLQKRLGLSIVNRLQATCRLRWLLWSLALGISLILCASLSEPIYAQPAETPPAEEESTADTSAEPAGAIASEGASGGRAPERGEPEIFYVEDGNGNLVPLLTGMTLQEIQEMYRIQQGLERPRPQDNYLLEEASITLDAAGATLDANGGMANASANFQIRCSKADWTRVPLGLPEMVLREAPTYEGEGKLWLEYKPESGYFAWLYGAAGGEHRLVLPLKTRIEERGSELRLRYSVPQATLSRLTATFDTGLASLISPRDTTLSQIENPSPEHTRWLAQGLEGEVELLWRNSEATVAQSTGVLDVETDLLVSVETQSNRRYNLHYEANLEVSSYGETVDRFTVALPAGASLVSSESTTYEAVELEGVTSPTGGPLVEVTLQRPTAGPIQIALEAEQEVAEPDPEQWLPVGGFQVLEAARQSGHVAISVQDDWQVRWRTGEGDPTVRRVEDLPEALAADSVVAPFAFDSQPFLLELRVFEREPQKRVEPVYIVRIENRELILDARLHYEVREGKVRYLLIDMGKWDLRSVGPTDIVMGGLPTTEAQSVNVQLKQSMAGEFELELSARHELLSDADEFTFTLPRPDVNSEGAATVIILAGNQLSLAPDFDGMVGWSPDVLPADIELPTGQGEPLVFRLESPQTAGPFSADVQRRSRESAVDLAGRATVHEGSIEVDQTLSYTVRYEPVSQLPLRLPVRLGDETAIEWRLDGQLLSTKLAAAGGDQAGEIRDYFLPLPAPQVGTFELTAHYALPRESDVGEQGEVRIPLLTPRDATLSTSEFVVASPESVGVQLNDTRWQRATALAAPGELLLYTKSLPNWVTLIATPLQTAEEKVLINRMWHQTWLTATRRRERAVFNLQSPANELQVVLPDTATLGQRPWISVDGYSVSAADNNAGVWVIPLQNRDTTSEHVVEIVYEFDRNSGPGVLPVVPPRIEGSSGPYRMYWELISQPGEVLVSSPSGMTDEADWRWGYLTAPLIGELPYPMRSPGWSQAEVEQWVGATTQARPPAGANRYLLSTFDEPAELQIRTASRAHLVLLLSALVLGIGLALMYVPRLVNLRLLFVLSVVVAALGIWHPPTALQIARMAALGVGMVILARVMLGLLTWQRRPAVLGSTSADSESRRTYLGPAIEDAGSGQTTATAPAATASIPLSHAESSQ